MPTVEELEVEVAALKARLGTCSACGRPLASLCKNCQHATHQAQGQGEWQ